MATRRKDTRLITKQESRATEVQVITHEETEYELKTERLAKKCETIKLQNYRLINHIYEVNKLVHKTRKQNEALYKRLEKYKNTPRSFLINKTNKYRMEKIDF